MPHLRGITVHVTDSQGKNLQEWGVQYLRQHTETKRVSAYVQSTTDASFQISLQPEIPFIGHVPPPDTLGGENASTRKLHRHRKASSEDRRDHGKLSSNTLSSPVRPSGTPQSHYAPDFAFLAVLYLDGRKKPERKIIVYTDPADKDFNSPDGKVTFKHRWVQSANGEMIEHAWVFKEKAIETVFDRLMIEGSRTNVEDQDDDALVKAMESSGFDAKWNTEKESKIGQIVVELRRILLGEKRTEAKYRSHHQEGQEEDIDIGVRPEIHSTGFVRQNTLNPQPLRVVDYWPYKPNEGLYATFQFFYRSREQLQKFHFPGFPPLIMTTAARTTRLLNAQMAELTPLSISLPPDKKTNEVLPDQDSYEAKLKERSFKPDYTQKHNFGSQYRDIQSTPPSAVDKAYKGKRPPKYPAARLPFLLNKPFENTGVDAIPSNTSPNTAGASFFAGQYMALDLRHKLQPQRHACQLFTSHSHATITAATSSSTPSSTNLTKEQTVNITDKDGYRPTAGYSYPSDQEEDANDEHAKESDFEIQAGDDDFNYSTIPEEKDEGYDNLQSQLKNVRICKRQRDDIEDAEDDNKAWQEDDAAPLNGNGEQKALKAPLTKEERAHRGKKSKTSAANGGHYAYGNEKTPEGGLV